MSKRVYGTPIREIDGGEITVGSAANPSAMSPLYQMHRTARATGRKPHGSWNKPPEHNCGFDPNSQWPDSLPWRGSWLYEMTGYDPRIIGQIYPKSQFRTLNRCGWLATNRAIKCGDISFDMATAYPQSCDCQGCSTVKKCDACTGFVCDDFCEKIALLRGENKADIEKREKELKRQLQSRAEAKEQIQEEFDDYYSDCGSDCGSECSEECASESTDWTGIFANCCKPRSEAPCPPPCNVVEEARLRQNARWAQQRRSFKPNRGLLANPSGAIEPIGYNFPRQQQARGIGAQSLRNSRMVPRVASRNFLGTTDPASFSNALRPFTVFTGVGQPICARGPQSLYSSGCG